MPTTCDTVRVLFGCLGLLAGCQALLGLGPAPPRPADNPPTILQLVDDRGRSFEERVEICFEMDLGLDCRHVLTTEGIPAPQGFHGLRVEGESHSLVELAREDLGALTAGIVRVKVPRKALLLVGRQPQGELVLSLYSPRDPSFRRPLLRVPLERGQIRIPAGTFIASLAATGLAPDLQRLSAKPATTVRMIFHPLAGWSLLVRCLARNSSGRRNAPLAKAQVAVAKTPGYGLPEKLVGEAVTGDDGVAMFSGLDVVMAGLRAKHPELLPAIVVGLTASPGTFAFREVALGQGGRVRGLVSVQGRGLAGARCSALASDLGMPGRRSPARILWEGAAGRDGACLSSHLPEGFYKLRVVPPHSNSQVDRWVGIVEGQETQVDLALSTARVSGEVKRGDVPLSGYKVKAMFLESEIPPGAQVGDAATAVSDADGRYEMTLWEAGLYSFSLRSPSQSPGAGHKELTLQAGDDQRLDFSLPESSFRGTVVDQDGDPVAEAQVTLRVTGSGLYLTSTDGAGRFDFAAEGEETGSVYARKIGYRDSETVQITIAAESPAPPVDLVLKRKQTLAGKVVASGGLPLPAAWVMSVEAAALAPRLYRMAQTDATGAFEIETPPGFTRLFVTGPGCPLFWADRSELAPGTAAEPEILQCPGEPASLELTIRDAAGKAVPHAGVILRAAGTVIPPEVLAQHLRLIGLPSESDGAGHLVVAGVMPGDYDLFLSTLASADTVVGGGRQGYASTASLPPLSTAELQITVGTGPAASPSSAMSPRL